MKKAFTMAGAGQRTPIFGLRSAFTMAEILLSLTIIGVVAAITLPSLTGNINERTWNTQREALYARFSQAISLMPALNGYGASNLDTAAETFITSGLSKVLKINNICANASLSDCGIVSTINTIAGSKFNTPVTMGTFNAGMIGSHDNGMDKMSVQDTKAAAFETANGESVIVYYNPSCIGSLKELPIGGTGGYFIPPKVCANFVYDLNGKKGPNTVGKDIGFITVVYPSDPKVVAPYPATRQLGAEYPTKSDTDKIASQACTEFDSEYRVPNTEEAISLFVNKELLKGTSSELNGYYATSGVISSSQMWFLSVSTLGQLDDHGVTTSHKVWCVKR